MMKNKIFSLHQSQVSEYYLGQDYGTYEEIHFLCLQRLTLFLFRFSENPWKMNSVLSTSAFFTSSLNQ